MKVASNKIGDVMSFYKKELSGVYEPEEIKLLINRCFSHYLHYTTADLIIKRNESINQSDLLKLYDCCLELKTNKPVQYVLGETEFYGLSFHVNSSVLIPRPETEELVELIVNENKNAEGLKILDIGTGSGCIAIALKKNLSGSEVTGIDISEEALLTAKENSALNKSEVLFENLNILDTLEYNRLGSFDVIVSNPPYISETEKNSMHDRVKLFEPYTALFVSNADPAQFYRSIFNFSKDHLKKGGQLYMELNSIFARDVLQLGLNSGVFGITELIKDLSGNERFLKCIK